jgi:hypothetical protein
MVLNVLRARAGARAGARDRAGNGDGEVGGGPERGRAKCFLRAGARSAGWFIGECDVL